jgi:hypothetical protein
MSSDADGVLGRAVEVLRRRQLERPWVMGVPSLGLARALGIAEPAMIRVLAGFVEAGALAYRSGYYATLDFAPQLSTEQRDFFTQACAAAPVSFDELRTRMRSSPVADLTPAFETLVATGELSKVGALVYRGADIAAMRALLEAALARQGQVTVAEFRTITGTSRKYAVPLLEFFDATGVTLRQGDRRVRRPPIEP